MIAIVGYGFVGKATEYLLELNGTSEVKIEDQAQGYMITDWRDIQIAFLCVPTPTSPDGKLDLTILKQVYELAIARNVIPVIRSTIGPEQVTQFPQAVMMPELLREAHWRADTEKTKHLIMGSNTPPTDVSKLFPNLPVIHTTPQDAMMFKLARNVMLAMKVAVVNEISEVCTSLDSDWHTVSQLLQLGGQLGDSHWDVPGPDGLQGFGGKCLPKDLSHMSSLTSTQPNLFDDALEINQHRRQS